jgi:polyketide synthase 13
VQVHARDGASFVLLFEAVVASGEPLPELVVAAPVAGNAVATTGGADIEIVETFGDRWDPEGTQTLEERLALIVAESMGYAVEDLPMEIPLMELGLDSLMAMRIKNRVEYEFDIPQLQIQAVRDANLNEVGKVLHYAIDHREEMQAMAEKQAAGEEIAVDGGFVAAARAALEAGEDPAAAVAKASGGEEVSQLDTESTSVEAAAEAIVTDAETAAGITGAAAGTAAPAPISTEQAAAAAAKEAAIERSLDTEDTTAQGAAEAVVAQSAPAETASVFGAKQSTDEDGVPPRDAAERLTFATWAIVTGKSAGGIFNTLPILEEELAEKMATRLTERVKAEVTVDDVLDCETIEQLADVVRGLQDSGADVDGFVRPLRARAEGSNAVPVFVFHPSGGNTLVYEPLLKRLPSDTPMYGFERVEGDIVERARQYLPELRKIQGDGPYVLYGWSLGAVFALQVAQLLRADGADVRVVGLIDLAIPTEGEDNSPEERVRRVERYQAFAKKTYGVEGELPQEQLEELAAAADDEQFKMISDLIKISGTKIPGGVLEHQRTSWIEGRHLAKTTPTHYDGDVVLYLADRYHDGMIELEPRYADRRPNGGWDEYIPNLEVVRIPGDHLQIVDEPRIGKIGADLAAKLAVIAP